MEKKILLSLEASIYIRIIILAGKPKDKGEYLAERLVYYYHYHYYYNKQILIKGKEKPSGAWVGRAEGIYSNQYTSPLLPLTSPPKPVARLNSQRIQPHFHHDDVVQPNPPLLTQTDAHPASRVTSRQFKCVNE